MSFPDSLAPVVDGVRYSPYYIQADVTPSSVNAIPRDRQLIIVSGNTTTDDVNYVQLPPIADVPVGHQIVVMADQNLTFSISTPPTSNTRINNVDSDGSNTYRVVGATITRLFKTTATDWVAISMDKLSANVTIVPVATSVSASVSQSPSASRSPSASASRSLSPSASLSPSSSSSASRSPSSSSSASRSPSASLSPSASGSSSTSASLSPSASGSSSSSASLSPSASVSRSTSPSASKSPSSSTSA